MNPVNLDSSPQWHTQNVHHSNITLYWAQEQPFDDQYLIELSNIHHHEKFIECFSKGLLAERKHFALVLTSPDRVVAAVDIIRSVPIFYGFSSGNFLVSNSAHLLKNKIGAIHPATYALYQFYMAGYVMGNDTIYSEIKQLRSGELLLWDITQKSLIKKKYYKYWPISKKETSNPKIIDRLNQFDAVLNRVFQRVIKKAQDDLICIPLSGGLDSRLVLAKLHQLKYKNLLTYSYGPPGNSQAIIARSVSESLKVPWRFLEIKNGYEHLNSKETKSYCDSADGLCSLPNLPDYISTWQLKKNKWVNERSIIINGQSGDFIAGNHIPDILMSGMQSWKQVISFIIEKHFKLWKQPILDRHYSNFESIIHTFYGSDITKNMHPETAVAFYENWEYEERQCKYVVNGQRAYEFFGMPWQLPLWDPEIVDFFKDLPLTLRYKRTFFREYLQYWNYKNLFLNTYPNQLTFTGFSRYSVSVVTKLASILKFSPQTYLPYFVWFCHYGNFYRMFGVQYFLKHIHKAQIPPLGRGIYALSVRKWFEENDLLKYVNKKEILL